MHVCRIKYLNPPPLLKHSSQGAQVLQAGLGDVPTRGGVPILFPQFANGGILPKHVVFRAVHWTLHDEQVSQISLTLSYGLSIETNDYLTWPYAARLSLLVEKTREAAPDASFVGTLRVVKV